MSENDQHLMTAVSTIEENAEKARRAKNVDQQVRSARTDIKSINSELDDLEQSVDRLQFYREVVFEAFDPDQRFGADEALADASDVVAVDSDALIQRLLSDGIEQYRAEIRDAEANVSDATDELKSYLEDRQAEWSDRISRARELQRIIGATGNDFDTTINWIERLITQRMWNPEKVAASVVQKWENATDQWEEHQDLQDLSAYQREHNLSDETIDVIESLSQSTSVTLSDVDEQTVSELQSVDELADSITLRI